MANKKSYAVIGLGRYGKAVAKELLQNGAEVLVAGSAYFKAADRAAFVKTIQE